MVLNNIDKLVEDLERLELEVQSNIILVNLAISISFSLPQELQAPKCTLSC